jgi:protein involved in polysaccharide export with SLBB domain
MMLYLTHQYSNCRTPKAWRRGHLAPIALLWCALVAGGCAAQSHGGGDIAAAPMARAHRDCVATPIENDDSYRIQPGDKLQIDFYLNSEFNTAAKVRPDGKVELAAVGETEAAGMTPRELEDKLNRLYSTELRNPGASVRVEEMPSRVVFVQGEVAHPGSVALQPGMTALQAIAASGGLTDSAGPGNVVLVRRDACGDPHDEPLNLAKALKSKGHEDDVVLAPADMLLVPRSGIATADLIVKQYFRDLMPVTPYISPVF